MGECPREKYIPIYLIVAGVFGIIKSVLGIAQMVSHLSCLYNVVLSPETKFLGYLSLLPPLAIRLSSVVVCRRLSVNIFTELLIS